VKTSDLIYLDHAAATPMDERVIAAMTPYMREFFYNPSKLVIFFNCFFFIHYALSTFLPFLLLDFNTLLPFAVDILFKNP